MCARAVLEITDCWIGIFVVDKADNYLPRGVLSLLRG